MKFKNIKIANQLNIVFGIILVVILITGAYSLFVSNSLWQNTKTIVEHPLSVSKASYELQTDIFNMRLAMKELIMAKEDQKVQKMQNDISTFQADAYKKFDVLFSLYLGPKVDVDNAFNSFVQWEPIREETIRLFRAGKIDEAITRTSFNGVGGSQAEKVINELSTINSFATNKAQSLYDDALGHRNQITLRITVLLVIAILVLAVIFLTLKQSIITPIKIINAATNAFKEGKINSRSDYKSNNEFGVLSKGFNNMLLVIQTGIKEKENVFNISHIMMSKNNLHPFSENLLKILLDLTDSQIGALYVLDDDENSFKIIESIGLNTANTASFSMQGREGEFGTVLATGEVQHLTDIPEDAQMTFLAVSGEYRVKEIITIPILFGDEVISVISIASIKEYSDSAVRLVIDSATEISARVNSILALKKIEDVSENLKIINSELVYRSKELAIQTERLLEQNILLEMQKKKLDEVNLLKNSFLSNMSHELRTPLNSVIALTSVLNRRLQGKIPEEEYSYLDVIERNGKGLLSLVNEILDISRIEAGKDEIILSKFDMKSLVKEVMEMFNQQAQKKGIVLIDRITHDHFEMNSDQNKCKHIVQNIISNAVKFTDKGSVEISFATEKENLNIIVRDTGIGIDPENISIVFDEFRQVDETPSRKAGGTGLGLAIAKKYAHLLGGNITVESTLGIGSTFTVVLPIKIPGMEPDEVEGYMGFAGKTGKTPRHLKANETRRIMLIEDSEPSIIQTTDYLENEGYTVYVSRNGKEALKKIESVMPDGIILDLLMPEMDGFQTLKEIRDQEKFADIPILILTEKDITKEELNFLKSNHVYQLIQKGTVNKKEFLTAIGNLVMNGTIDAKISEKPVPISAIVNKRHTILVVEDNPDNVITVTALLKEKYNIEVAIDGIIGVEKAGNVNPSLILMDISLPGMNGFQAFTEIRKIEELKHIPVIAMTASAMAGSKEEILEYGFDGYISKPIDINEMDEVIGRYLNGE